MIASASAKVILFGEHAVVYGQPAIAIPVSSLRATVDATANNDQGLQIIAADLNQVLPVSIGAELVDSALVRTAQLVLQALGVAKPPNVTLTLRSTIPMASGLGSGAAVTAALARALSSALGKPLPDEALNALVYSIEEIYHGTPSGVDNTVVVYERPVFFVKGQRLETLAVQHTLTFVIADTGNASLTRLAVGDVRRLVENAPSKYLPIIEAIGTVTQSARTAIENGDSAVVGRLMTENHTLLTQLTVSSLELDQLVATALSAGASGAKLSGGGRGGNMIALVDKASYQSVKQALMQAGAARVFLTELAPVQLKL